MLFPGGHSSSSVNPARFNSQKAHDSQPLCGWIKVSQCLLILRVAKKVWVLQRPSTEATWITAPEVSGKAVNINDSYHPPPGLLQPSSLHFSSSALFKGKESCSEQERQYCWQESPPPPSLVGGKSHSTICIAGLRLLKVSLLFHQITGYRVRHVSCSKVKDILPASDHWVLLLVTFCKAGIPATSMWLQQMNFRPTTLPATMSSQTFIPFFSSHFFCFAMQEIAVPVLAKKESFPLVICVAEMASNHR